MEVLDKIRELLEPIASEKKYYIVDITYKREAGKLVLRVLVDKTGGITMEECTRLNNELSELLDKENTIEEKYTLEVSSPGLNRKLKKHEDFVWAVGKNIKVTTYAPLDGENVFRGCLLGVGDSTIVLEKNGVSTKIPMDRIANAKLELDIDWSKR